MQIIEAVGIKRVSALLAVAGTAMVLASKPAARVQRDAPADRITAPEAAPQSR